MDVEHYLELEALRTARSCYEDLVPFTGRAERRTIPLAIKERLEAIEARLTQLENPLRRHLLSPVITPWYPPQPYYLIHLGLLSLLLKDCTGMKC